MKQFTLFTMLFVVAAAQTPGFDPIGSYVTDDSCGTQYHKRTIATCSNPIETFEDCQLAASAIGNSVTPVNLAAFPQGCYLHESRMVLFNVNVNAQKCDVIGVRFCLCRDSNLHCRSQQGQVPTNTLTPPPYKLIDGIMSLSLSANSLTENENHIVVGKSTPFQTGFIKSEIEASFKQSTVDVSTKVTTSPLFYVSDTGRAIFKQKMPNEAYSTIQNQYTYKRIIESSCSAFGWELIESPEECKEAARSLKRVWEQMQIVTENGAVFEQDNSAEPKGCYHKWIDGDYHGTGRLYYNVDGGNTECSDTSGAGCLCKKKTIQNYMVRESGYCTDLVGWTVIPSIPECDFAGKNIPEYLATLSLNTPGVIRTIEQHDTVGSNHKFTAPGCFMQQYTSGAVTEMTLHFNVNLNPQGDIIVDPTGPMGFMTAHYNDATEMYPCSVNKPCICKRAPYKTIDSGRCSDTAGWQNIEDRPTPSALDTHDYPGECRKAIEFLSSNSNLLSLSLNMANSANPQIEGLAPNLGHSSHIINPPIADIASVNLLNHMGGTYDIAFKPSGCSIGTGSSNAAYSYNRGTREEVFTMVEFNGKEYATAPNTVNEVTCTGGRQCVCKIIPEYRRVCAKCNGNEPVCLEFQNIDKFTQMEIDWNVEGVYALGIFDDTPGIPTEYVLEIIADLSWSIGTVVYTENTQTATPQDRGFTYEYLVKRDITYTPNSRFVEAKKTGQFLFFCNNALTTDSTVTVEKFTKEKSVPDLERRVATSGTSCGDFNYDLISTAGDGQRLCERKPEDNYKEITTGFCASEKNWEAITTLAGCEEALLSPDYSQYSNTVTPMNFGVSGCLAMGTALKFNAVDQLYNQLQPTSFIRSICKRQVYTPEVPKQWNDMAVMSLQHVTVPDENGDDLEIAVRETWARPVYDEDIIFREYDGDDLSRWTEFRTLDSGVCSDLPGGTWQIVQGYAECQHILRTYKFHIDLDPFLAIVTNTGTVDPVGCILKNQQTTGVTMRYNSNSASVQTCGSFLSPGGTWKHYRCLCKRSGGPIAMNVALHTIASNLKNGFYRNDRAPMRDTAVPKAACDGDGCVTLYDVNECLATPCLNGATCTDSTTDNSIELSRYHCECATGYAGTNCEYDIDACDPDLCQNGACASKLEMQSYELFLEDELSKQCSNFINVFGSSFTQEQCYEAVKLNREELGCSGRTYQYQSESNECSCASDDCTLKMFASDWKIYIQANLSHTHTCECATGFTGENCEEDINECDPDPCQNGAVCTETSDGSTLTPAVYHCDCALGYGGKNCDVDIDECEFNDANTCLNGGTCTQTTDGTTPALGVFHCDCLPGWTGDRCEEDLDECNTSPQSSYVTHARSSDASFGTSDDFSSSCSDVCEARGQVCNPQMFSDILGNTQGMSGIARSRCQIQVDVFLPLYGVDVGGSLIADGSVQAQQSPVDWICSKCPLYPAAETVRAQSTNPDCFPGVYYGENPQNTALTQNIFFWNMDLDPNGYDCDFKASENVKNIMCECTTANPCQNSGVCTESGTDAAVLLGEYNCECPVGTTGTRCEIDTNECDPDPCQNSGVCTESGTDSSVALGEYHCACPTGYSGTNCEEDTDECDPDPCQNGAFCTSVVDNAGIAGYTCTCPTGYSGVNCEEDINECDTNPCQNSGVCTETSDGTTPTVGVYHCECPAGYTDYACHIHIPCDTNPCQNGATCSESVVTDPAPTYTIIGHQNTCSSYADGYRGLTADECENVPNTVAMVLYQGGLGIHTYGACAYNGMGGTMLGVIDDSQPDLCFFSSCACIKPVVEYTCDCEAGYNGTNCETDINECNPDPCQYGAVCTESATDSSVALGEYHCECANGYTGTNCNECGPGKGQDSEVVCTECNQPQINNVITHSAPCADQECPEGFGVSSDNWDILGGNCAECPAGEESMAGTGVCSNINECDPDPCQNGAACTETSDGSTPALGVFHCACPAGYTGTNCEEDIDECDPDPCQNSATCTETSDGITPSAGVFHCACPTGYSGTNCEIIVDPCQLATCNSGECLTSIIMQPYNTFVEDIDQTIAL